jgi:hypothetical protein
MAVATGTLPGLVALTMEEVCNKSLVDTELATSSHLLCFSPLRWQCGEYAALLMLFEI